MRLYEPYQDFGARATSHLASRIASVLLPTGTPSFYLRVPTQVLIANKELAENKDVQQGLALSRELIATEIERKNWRIMTVEALTHLIIAGNVLEQVLPDGSIKLYRLDQYMVVRDPSDNLLEIITADRLSPETYKALVGEAAKGEEITLLTRAIRKKDSFEITQEANGKPVGRRIVIKEALLPYNALRWSVVAGQAYGRGKIELHAGPLRSLEGYCKSLTDGAAMAARHVWGVAPNATGGNLRKRLATARNGDVLSFNEGDVHMLQFQNIGGLQVVQAEKMATLQQLSASFLMGPDRVRDAERVTAAEIRMLAEELEGVLGGVYSMLARDMQLPRIRQMINLMKRQKKLPPFPDEFVEPEITTGLEALSQEQKLVKLQSAVALAQGLDPQQEYVKNDVLLGIGMNALGFANAVRSEEEATQIRQQRAAMQAAAAMAPTMAEAAMQGDQGG